VFGYEKVGVLRFPARCTAIREDSAQYEILIPYS
jgi:hypothetical protein